VSQDISDTTQHVLDHAISTDVVAWGRYEDLIKKDDADFAADLAGYARVAHTRGVVAQLNQDWQNYQRGRDQMMAASRRGDYAEVARLRDHVAEPASDKAKQLVERVIVQETANARQRVVGATRTYRIACTVTVVALIFGLLFAIGYGRMVARMVVLSVRMVSNAVDGLAVGDLTRTAKVLTEDEIGAMALGLNHATATLRAALGRIDGTSQQLSSSAQNLNLISEKMAGNAGRVSARAEAVSEAAKHVSQNVETVALSSDELAAAIQQIAGNAGDAATVASRAVEVATATSGTAHQLRDSSEQINNVVNLIATIVEQTNLLAINASIEAAHAGAVGRGFAVVASEVKELAQATSEAAGDASGRIVAVQDQTGVVVESILRITDVIEKVRGVSSIIASAVEEQATTTIEIGRNMAEAATGTNEIAQGIADVASDTELTNAGIAESRCAAKELAQISRELRGMVAEFKI
jgi:methyl-accepting chemotaxis protein